MGIEQSIENEKKSEPVCTKEGLSHQSLMDKIKQKTSLSKSSTKKKPKLLFGKSNSRPISGSSFTYTTPRHSLSGKSTSHDLVTNNPMPISRPSSPTPSLTPPPAVIQKNAQGDITPPLSIEEKKNSLLVNSAPQDHHYLSSQEVVLDLYLRPNNERDRRKERDRQQRLHYLLKLIWKGIYSADLKDPSVIVSWCCGVGLWNMEMAALFPNTKIIGVDFKEATFQNSHYSLPNMEFRYAVIHDKVTGLESFESNSVDFFIMRDCWLINAPIYKWDNVFREAYRILKPGGFIEVEEHNLELISKGENSDLLYAYFGRFFEEVQVERDLAIKLGSRLTDAGFEQVEQRSVVIPVGEWPSTECLRETGFLARDLLERRIRGLRKWVCESNGITEQQFDTVVTQTMDVEVNKHPSFIDWNSYTARKPGHSSPCRNVRSLSNANSCSANNLFMDIAYIGPNRGKF